MNKLSKEAQWFLAQAAELEKALSSDEADAWRKARADNFVSSAEGVVANKRSGGRKRKPVGRWAASHAYMILTSAVAAKEAGAKLSPPCKSLVEIIQPDLVHQLMQQSFSHCSGTTKSILLRNLGSFAKRILNVDAPWLRKAAKRIERREPRKDQRSRRRPYDVYVSAALDLAPDMLPGEPHDVETALEARHAASFGIAAEGALRRGEMCGLEMDDVVIDRIKRRVTILIRAETSKSFRKQSIRLSEAVGDLVIDYCDNARALFVAESSASRTPALWLTRTGTPLGQAGLAAALRANAQRLLGSTVSFNLCRQAMASRVDIPETDAGARLGHSRLSTLANNLYAERDRKPGQIWLQDAWKTIRERGFL